MQELPQNVSKLNNILLEDILVYSPYENFVPAKFPSSVLLLCNFWKVREKENYIFSD